MQEQERVRIRELNDRFRTTFSGGRVVTTTGIGDLGAETQAAVLQQVKGFSAFDDESDPFGKHDFGKITVAGHTVFWKIGYFGKTLEEVSEDPSDPSKTTRVLTIMLAEEH